MVTLIQKIAALQYVVKMLESEMHLPDQVGICYFLGEWVFNKCVDDELVELYCDSGCEVWHFFDLPLPSHVHPAYTGGHYWSLDFEGATKRIEWVKDQIAILQDGQS